VLAHFGAYTYVRPFLEAVPQAGPGTITALLLSYGATGILGDFLGGAAPACRPHAAFGAIAACSPPRSPCSPSSATGPWARRSSSTVMTLAGLTAALVVPVIWFHDQRNRRSPAS